MQKVNKNSILEQVFQTYEKYQPGNLQLSFSKQIKVLGHLL